jgi:uncharacterized membrane protein YhaH (DUF805 family)
VAVDFAQAVKSGFRNYATFGGRASRSEYWYWVLFSVIVAIVTAAIDYLAFPNIEFGPINTIASLALLLPDVAVTGRRLHDIDRTAWWILIVATVIGVVLLLIWNCMKGTSGPNRFGPDPLASV